MAGHFTPTCDDNGNYAAVQNHASTGYFWCVDPKTGKKFDGSDNRFAPPDCGRFLDGKF